MYSFSGTRINRTISYLLTLAGLKNDFDDSSSSFEVDIPKQDFIDKWETLTHPLGNIDSHISYLLETNPAILDFSKWGSYLPLKFKIELVKQKYFDFTSAGLIQSFKLIENK